jgi:hypothetical protein
MLLLLLLLLLRLAQVLDSLFDANNYLGSRIPLLEFYNRSISETANLKDEYLVSSVYRVIGMTPIFR